MLRLMFCLVRAKDLTHEQFLDHWRNVHAPLVKTLRKPLRIARYAQIPIAPPEGVPKPNPEADQFDGVAELVWESLEDYMVRSTTPEGIEATKLLNEDSRKFMRLSKCVPLWGYEEQVF